MMTNWWNWKRKRRNEEIGGGAQAPPPLVGSVDSLDQTRCG